MKLHYIIRYIALQAGYWRLVGQDTAMECSLCAADIVRKRLATVLLQVTVGNWKRTINLLSQQFTVLHLVTI